jgi:hypothetical protein
MTTNKKIGFIVIRKNYIPVNFGWNDSIYIEAKNHKDALKKAKEHFLPAQLRKKIVIKSYYEIVPIELREKHSKKRKCNSLAAYFLRH